MENTPNVTRKTLSNIDPDDAGRRWYLSQDVENDRVDAVLNAVS